MDSTRESFSKANPFSPGEAEIAAQEERSHVAYGWWGGKWAPADWHRLNPASRAINAMLWMLDKKRITHVVESATKVAPLGLTKG